MVLEFYDGADAQVWQMLLGEALHIGGISASKQLAEMLEIGKDWQVLDVGTGAGASARMLASQFGCLVKGVEVSAQMRRKAIALNQQAGLEARIEVVDGSAEALPFPDANFDLVWSEDVLYHLQDKRKALGEAWRVLRAGGKLALTDWVETQLGLTDVEFARAASFLVAPFLETVRGYTGVLSGLGAAIELSEELFYETSRALLSLIVRLRTEIREEVTSNFGSELYDYYDRGLSGLVEAVQGQHLARTRIIARKP